MKFCTHKESEPEHVPGLKLGIIRLGRAAGKVKYTLLDEPDISLVQKFGFEARVDIDPNGNGAAVYAWAYDICLGKTSGQYVHELLWEIHRGGIPPGWKVIHRNKVTVDNRLENLALVPISLKSFYFPCLTQLREQSMYWVAIQQLPSETIEEYYNEIIPRAYFVKGEYRMEEPELFYECRYPPCTNIEREPRQFSICGRCQEARYCGTHCQQKDWAFHKKLCKERRRPIYYERPPER